ncbi:MAG: type I DNA topoisomerase [Nitrospinae bacterium]|nr:type I DNA topoisomerase [Nitrospinota bacterium]MBI3813057.1 type I DNA topoisomerase [Nitrospinota bacterium]
MSKSLVIVESPAKASTLKKFLGDTFQVKASVGHVKDLPKKKLGVAVEKNFEPEYITIRGKGKILQELRSAAKKADAIYLAPDPDREGEAIAWHIAQELNGSSKIYRVLFHEITKSAVKKAIENPGKIDENKVYAQQARRILDRLVGYKISPLLWKKVRGGLSAGRVQSVALRLICEREKEIKSFVSEEYWSIIAAFENPPQPPFEKGGIFEARLLRIGTKKAEIKNEAEAKSILSDLEGAVYKVSDIQKKEKKRYPVPPFITSTLQQEASRKLRFSAKKTMMLAQRLYEGLPIGDEGHAGLITYMRTDSVRLSSEAVGEARDFIQKRYGRDFLPETPNAYKSRKTAQDAHEAIRPTSVIREPSLVKKYLEKDEASLYELIWNRFVACQMNPAVFDATSADIEAERKGQGSGLPLQVVSRGVRGQEDNKLAPYLFRATGSVVRFPGFMKVYEETKESMVGQASRLSSEESETEEAVLPPLSIGEILELIQMTPNQHFTQPPPRYTEAALIKEMEDKGIGRPSTYASIMSTILQRDYVEAKERRLHPTPLGVLISDLLVENFPKILDVKFTANMEEELDQIEEGKKGWVDALNDFYKPFSSDLKTAESNMRDVKKEVEMTDEICNKCGKNMVIRWGRFGRFLACSNYPECKNTRPLESERQSNKAAEPVITDEKCDKCGAPMQVKQGRYGKFLACTKYPECKSTKPISLGVPCPQEGCTGSLVERRTKKGKTFYSCSNYPTCKFATWNKPIAEKCSECGHPYLIEKRTKSGEVEIRCGNKDCTFKRAVA